MIIKMTLLEDTIFGNGKSIPGEEDISVLHDDQGFPYFKGSTFKGIFREELERLLEWKGVTDKTKVLNRLLGEAGADNADIKSKLVFSDFMVSENVRNSLIKECSNPNEILNIFTSMRTFTKIDEDGMVKDKSLRVARCVNKGISFFGTIECQEEDTELVSEVLNLIKWVGTLRNRGFGKVKVSVFGGK